MLLGFLFIYFIGKYFYQLAERYKENKWLFAILGIVMYYASGGVVGVVLAIIGILLDFEIDWDNTILMAVLGLASGISSCWLFYYLLEKKWKKKQLKPIEDINDIGKEIDN